jgi:hypothetical protein
MSDIATFENAEVGMRLVGYREVFLMVTSKDELRVNLEADDGKTLSLYAPEFDARGFEVIPVVLN